MSTTEENKDIVRRYWEAVGRFAYDEAFPLVEPDADFHYMGAMFGPEGFHRSAAQQRADGENHVGDVGQPSTEVRSVIGEGDTVVAEVHWTYRTGVHGSFPLDWDTDHVAIHTMRDGRIAHVRVYIDTEFQARLVAQEQELAQSDG